MIAALSAAHSPGRALSLAMAASQAVVEAWEHRLTHKPCTIRVGRRSFPLSPQGLFEWANAAADPSATCHASPLIEDRRQIVRRDTSAAIFLCANRSNPQVPVTTQRTIRSRGPPTAQEPQAFLPRPRYGTLHNLNSCGDSLIANPEPKIPAAYIAARTSEPCTHSTSQE
jgi:ribosomal protein S12 methylthiotransferase accessory factor YcaO